MRLDRAEQARVAKPMQQTKQASAGMVPVPSGAKSACCITARSSARCHLKPIIAVSSQYIYIDVSAIAPLVKTGASQRRFPARASGSAGHVTFVFVISRRVATWFSPHVDGRLLFLALAFRQPHPVQPLVLPAEFQRVHMRKLLRWRWRKEFMLYSSRLSNFCRLSQLLRLRQLLTRTPPIPQTQRAAEAHAE